MLWSRRLCLKALVDGMLMLRVVLNLCAEDRKMSQQWERDHYGFFFQYWSLWLLYLHNEGSVCEGLILFLLGIEKESLTGSECLVGNVLRAFSSRSQSPPLLLFLEHSNAPLLFQLSSYPLWSWWTFPHLNPNGTSQRPSDQTKKEMQFCWIWSLRCKTICMQS